MFKKAAPSATTLSDRVRKVGDAKPTPAAVHPATIGPGRPPRQPQFRNGVLIVGSERLSVAITNLSATGARVEFSYLPVLPGEVVLADPTRGLRRRARVAWIKDGAIGLEFIENT